MKNLQLSSGCSVEMEGRIRFHSDRAGRRVAAAPRANQAAARSDTQPLPIWLAALLVTSFHADSGRAHHAVRWNCDSGRATYTNSGHEDERIEPLGVSLPRGQTLAVSWVPGGTTYTLEVYQG